MRLDKYLKQSRLIKRRVVAKEAAENSFVYVNDKIVKPSYKLSIGDIIKINFKKKSITVKVTSISQFDSMYDLIDEKEN
ncbi:MAG: RNA-binding S4 domain-containing protein [Acholeplasmataceae bacterium]|jgi:ribosomal 50S subunit-recycling heat shock protein|nr:RNA-binding S4 domain-containing protein [Acholeplasmataceae bacterium]